MHIGLNLWTTPNTWWPPGASYAADFAADRYMRDGEPVAAAAAFAVARSSVKYAADGAGNFVLFGTDSAARTDCGLSIEAASSNILINPIALDAWGTALADAAPLAGTVLGLFDHPTLVTDTAGNVVARLRHPAGQSIVSGQSYALSIWFQVGSSPSMVTIASGNGGSSRLVIALSDGTIAGSSNGRGEMTMLALTQPAPGIHCAQMLWVPNFSGTCEIAIGPGTAVIGDTIIALGAFLEPGTTCTSPIIGSGAPSSRAADIATLHLPAGSHELTVTFADQSVQMISGATGDFVVPTDLDEAVIRSIVAMAD